MATKRGELVAKVAKVPKISDFINDFLHAIFFDVRGKMTTKLGGCCEGEVVAWNCRDKHNNQVVSF